MPSAMGPEGGRPSLSVIIPAYNEEARLEGTLQRVQEYLDGKGWEYEILVVDSGSRDGTAAIAERFRRRCPRLDLLRTGGKRGKGAAVRKGMLEGRGDSLLFSDADLSTPIEEVDKLLKEIESGCDVALGSRAAKGADIQVRQPFYRETMGKIFNLFVRALAVRGFGDTQCGFKCFRREAARDIFARGLLDGFAFDVEVVWLALKRGYRVREVPVVWRNELRSRVHPLFDSSRMLADLFRLRFYDWMGRYDRFC